MLVFLCPCDFTSTQVHSPLYLSVSVALDNITSNTLTGNTATSPRLSLVKQICTYSSIYTYSFFKLDIVLIRDLFKEHDCHCFFKVEPNLMT